jgi:hypothetical protein
MKQRQIMTIALLVLSAVTTVHDRQTAIAGEPRQQGLHNPGPISSTDHPVTNDTPLIEGIVQSAEVSITRFRRAWGPEQVT